jgi:hypothetical protein
VRGQGNIRDRFGAMLTMSIQVQSESLGQILHVAWMSSTSKKIGMEDAINQQTLG